jgi:hypothetical protein
VTSRGAPPGQRKWRGSRASLKPSGELTTTVTTTQTTTQHHQHRARPGGVADRGRKRGVACSLGTKDRKFESCCPEAASRDDRTGRRFLIGQCQMPWHRLQGRRGRREPTAPVTPLPSGLLSNTAYSGSCPASDKVAFSPDGRFLPTQMVPGGIQIWDVDAASSRRRPQSLPTRTGELFTRAPPRAPLRLARTQPQRVGRADFIPDIHVCVG